MEEAVADPAQKQALSDMVAASQVLGKLTGEDLAAALGLSVGFSSLDGD
jgi:predicted lipoprotein